MCVSIFSIWSFLIILMQNVILEFTVQIIILKRDRMKKQSYENIKAYLRHINTA